jgi:hypothetical protein
MYTRVGFSGGVGPKGDDLELNDTYKGRNAPAKKQDDVSPGPQVGSVWSKTVGRLGPLSALKATDPATLDLDATVDWSRRPYEDFGFYQKHGFPLQLSDASMAQLSAPADAMLALEQVIVAPEDAQSLSDAAYHLASHIGGVMDSWSQQFGGDRSDLAIFFVSMLPAWPQLPGAQKQAILDLQKKAQDTGDRLKAAVPRLAASAATASQQARVAAAQQATLQAQEIQKKAQAAADQLRQQLAATQKQVADVQAQAQREEAAIRAKAAEDKKKLLMIGAGVSGVGVVAAVFLMNRKGKA